jgi:hypothetical protein
LDDARKAVRLACITTLAICLAGLLAVPVAGTPQYVMYSLFFDQFAKIELWPLLLPVAFAIATLVALRRRRDDSQVTTSSYSRARTVVLAAVVAVVALAGARLVFGGYLLADDEYSAWFQSRIFAHGVSSATLPHEWCGYMGALSPSSVASRGPCQWRLGFLPLHSLLNAPFVAIHADHLGVALFSAASLLLIAAIARKVWPSAPHRAWLAALFFAASTQMLFMSMTFFSMPTHLFVSLIWLWLYVDDRSWSILLLPWVGVVALGVHSPFPHALFAAAFVLRYLLRRRFIVFGYVSVVYLAGLLFWHQYIFQPAGGASSIAGAAGNAAGLVPSLFQIPTAELRLTAAMHLSLIASWNSALLMLLVIAAMLQWKRLDEFSRYAAASLLFTVIIRLFLFPTPQGEGWGYRFIYDGLGLLCLLAAVGSDVLSAALGRRRAMRLVAVSLAAAVVLQIPLRVYGVRRIVGPYRHGYEWMSSLPADVVIYRWDEVMWGRQLLRNDPFLANRPKLLGANELPPHARDSLRARGLVVREITRDELKAIGLPIRITAVGHILIGN